MMTYSKQEKALIFLSTFEFMSYRKYQDIMSVFEDLYDIFSPNMQQLKELKNILNKNYEELADGIKNFNETTFFEILETRGVKCLTILSNQYPNNLKRLAQPPMVLYYIGNIDLLNTNIVAMVGTRNPSTYGKIVTQKFAKALAKEGLTIVSGMASGIDKLSHEGALEVGGNTIAVLGGGFDHIFPTMNTNLFKEICEKGLVLSEYFLTVSPTKYTFPARNRIIAGLSDYIIITEAGRKSGSLYTMEFGTEIGVDTYCVPGNITNELSYATNELIKKGICACLTCPEDILCLFGIKASPVQKNVTKQVQMSLEENSICNLLKDGERDFDYLQEKTGLSTQNLNISLTSLEISGIIKKLAGNSYVLINDWSSKRAIVFACY